MSWSDLNLIHDWKVTITTQTCLFLKFPFFYVFVISDWNQDWQPGKFPETPEERERAAKKYGLRLEDYEPYPDDGTGLGDYPKLPPVSAEGRDPYVNWDMPELKRNFGEPVSDIVLYNKHYFDLLTNGEFKPCYACCVIVSWEDR